MDAESFKVLIKELQSLCLDVGILDENNEFIEIKEDDDDITETAKELEVGIDLVDDSKELGEVESDFAADLTDNDFLDDDELELDLSQLNKLLPNNLEDDDLLEEIPLDDLSIDEDLMD